MALLAMEYFLMSVLCFLSLKYEFLNLLFKVFFFIHFVFLKALVSNLILFKVYLFIY